MFLLVSKCPLCVERERPLFSLVSNPTWHPGQNLSLAPRKSCSLSPGSLGWYSGLRNAQLCFCQRTWPLFCTSCKSFFHSLPWCLQKKMMKCCFPSLCIGLNATQGHTVVHLARAASARGAIEEAWMSSYNFRFQTVDRKCQSELSAGNDRIGEIRSVWACCPRVEGREESSGLLREEKRK